MKQNRKLLLVLFILMMAMSCSSPKKASKQIVRAYVKYPDVVAGHCGLWFEPITITKDSFIYKQGATIYKQGEPVYVQVDCDSVVNSSKKPNSSNVRIPCPPCDSVRVDTVYRSRETTEVNKAKEQALQTENIELKTELATEKQAKENWRKAAIISFVIIALILVILFFKSKIGKWFGVAKSFVGG